MDLLLILRWILRVFRGKYFTKFVQQLILITICRKHLFLFVKTIVLELLLTKNHIIIASSSMVKCKIVNIVTNDGRREEVYLVNCSQGSKLTSFSVMVYCSIQRERAALGVPVAVLEPHQRKADLKNTMGDHRVHPLYIFRIQNNRYKSHLHTTKIPHTKKLTKLPVSKLNTWFKLQTELLQQSRWFQKVNKMLFFFTAQYSGVTCLHQLIVFF